MILKVRTDDGTSIDDVPVKHSWRLYDGVEELHYTLYGSEKLLDSKYVQWGKPEDVQEIWHTHPKPADGEILFAAFYTQTQGAVHLFVNTECYLLNDNGRTIERLI